MRDYSDADGDLLLILFLEVQYIKYIFSCYFMLNSPVCIPTRCKKGFICNREQNRHRERRVLAGLQLAAKLFY